MTLADIAALKFIPTFGIAGLYEFDTLTSNIEPSNLLFEFVPGMITVFDTAVFAAEKSLMSLIE